MEEIMEVYRMYVRLLFTEVQSVDRKPDVIVMTAGQ